LLGSFDMRIQIVGFLLLLTGCVGSVDQKLEQIQFMLDQGQYAEAATAAAEVVAASPDNLQARFLFASARLGQSSLSARSRCPNDTGYLGILACLQDERTSTETSDLATFRRIAPDNTDRIGELETATDTLIGLTSTVTDPTFLRDVYLQLWMARMFEIAGVTTQLKACTTEFDPNLSDAELARFRSNLENAPGDAANAGLPGDLELNSRVSSILDGLNAATTAVDFFNATFGGGC
jgi:hypothetical protein